MKLKQLTNKITARISCKENKGSGVIFNNDKLEKYIYIYTAKHCLCGKDFSDNIDISDIKVEIKDDSDDSFEKIKIIDFLLSNNNDDFAILVCDKEDIKSPLVELPKINLSDKVEYSNLIRGFPFSHGHRETCSFEISLAEPTNSLKKFDVKSKTPLSDFHNSSQDNVQGLSGSGVFYLQGGILNLVGIVTSIKKYDILECIEIKSRINLVLESKNYPLIKQPIIRKSSLKNNLKTRLNIENNMNHYLDIEGNDLLRLRDELFPRIAKGDAILIMGSGTLNDDDKNTIENRIITQYSSDNGVDQFSPDTLSQFVDILKETDRFSYKEFEQFVLKFYTELPIPDSYKVISTIRWKEIITINPELFLETFYSDTSNPFLQVVYDKTSYSKGLPLNEFKYVKLYGSLNDLSLYPLTLSTEDIKEKDKYFRTIAKALSNLSYKIPIIFGGFSDTNKNTKLFFDILKKHNFQSGWIYKIDPYIPNIKNDFFKKKKVCIIKSTFETFFREYKKWEEEGFAEKCKRIKNNFSKKNNYPIAINNKISYELGKNVVQLNKSYNYRQIKPISFYEGQEPSFDVINNDCDVPKKKMLEELKSKIVSIDFTETNQDIIPLYLLTGTYCSGKTTFSYRLIRELTEIENFDCLAFEILDTEKITSSSLHELFRIGQAKNYIIYINAIEVDSIFKNLFNFQKNLSINWSYEYNIIIISSIRDNILQKYSRKRFDNLFTKIDIEAPFSLDECSEFVDKIKIHPSIKIKDNEDQKEFIDKIMYDFGGDAFVALHNLLPEGSHAKSIRSTYLSLSDKTQKALFLVSLLYRFKIKMPASLLKELLGMTWDSFTEQIMKIDGKNILIQEEAINHRGTEPDMFFITKHSSISEEIVSINCKTGDKKYRAYNRVLNQLNGSNSYHAKLAVNLLKSLDRNQDLTNIQLCKLYDNTGRLFDDNPHFVLHYAMNLQNRKTIGNHLENLKKAEEILMYVQREDSIYRPNHYLIHRRGTINFNLAKEYYEQNKIELSIHHIEAAKEFLERKKYLDPDSPFSYKDLLKLEIWYFDKFLKEEIKDEKKHTDINTQYVVIEQIIDEGKSTIYGKGNLDELCEIENEYRIKYQQKLTNKYLTNLLEQLESNEKNRPYILLRIFHYYKNKNETIFCHKYISELEDYVHINTVALEVFKYYGRHLYLPNYRVKLYGLIKNCEYLQDKDFLRFNYYQFVSYSYDHHFREAFDFLEKLRERFNHKKINPFISDIWKDNENSAKIFNGRIVRKRNKKEIKVDEINNRFPISRKNKIPISFGDIVTLKLSFSVYGIRCIVIENLTKINNENQLR